MSPCLSAELTARPQQVHKSSIYSKRKISLVWKLSHVFQLSFSFPSNDNDADDATNDDNKQKDDGNHYGGKHGSAATGTPAQL